MPEQIKKLEDLIDTMDAEDMARLQRFAPSGHPIFRTDLLLYKRFAARFKALGGMTPTISKRIGW